MKAQQMMTRLIAATKAFVWFLQNRCTGCGGYVCECRAHRTLTGRDNPT